MNQEKIMKVRMMIAYIVGGFALIGLFIFMALFIEETHKTKEAYMKQYLKNMTFAKEELDVYLDKGKDYDLHYNMIISDLGTARSMIFLLDDIYTVEQQNTINELHYCFVKYPEQMSGKFEESSKAIGDIIDNLDKGYEEAHEIVESIDKKGF